jgi:DNA ligase-1
MLLETTAEPFDDERYIFQPKTDGHRAIIVRHNAQTCMYTRNGNDVTRLYPELHVVPVGCLDRLRDKPIMNLTFPRV